MSDAVSYTHLDVYKRQVHSLSEYAGEKSYLFQCDIIRYAQRQEKRNKKWQEHLWQKTGKDTRCV